MDQRDGVWLEAAAAAQEAADTELRLDAFEVYQAEAARSRLTDRIGWATVTLHCGTVLVGEVGRGQSPAPEGTLLVRRSDSSVIVVPVSAVAGVVGSSAGLRDEGELPVSLASVLRECWATRASVRLLLPEGQWTAGTIVFVGADHVELHREDENVAIPYAAVQAWNLGDRFAG
ncbi:MAG: hypothetical protein WCP95_11595 [Actinomycetes bacterium]